MKKTWCSLLLAVLVLLTAAGCGSAFEKEYYYEEPFSGDFGTPAGDVTEIRNYSMLKTALTGMISRREERGDFRLNNYNGNPSEDLASVCYEIKSSNPLGTYAVETLSYETNYVVSYYVATVYITYHRSAEEIAAVHYASGLAELDEWVRSAVDEREPETVIRIYASTVDETYLRNLVHSYYLEHSVTQVAEPTVQVDSYPVEGPNRIYVLKMDYGLPEFVIEPMAWETKAVIADAALILQEQHPDPAKLALDAAVWLSDLCAGGDGETGYPDTPYGALVRHNAGPKGLALAYRGLCDALGLECVVAEGTVGAKGGETHFWNIIGLDGAYYHVDISAFAENPEKAFLLNDESLWGTCIWDTERYPACAGPLRYADVVPPAEEPAETEEPGETSPEDTLSPAEEPPAAQPENENSEEKSENTP